MVHVSQWEQILGVRFRGGLFVPGYIAQPLNQDDLVREFEAVDGPTALAAFIAVRQMTLALAQVALSGRARADVSASRAGHD